MPNIISYKQGQIKRGFAVGYPPQKSKVFFSNIFKFLFNFFQVFPTIFKFIHFIHPSTQILDLALVLAPKIRLPPYIFPISDNILIAKIGLNKK